MASTDNKALGIDELSLYDALIKNYIKECNDNSPAPELPVASTTTLGGVKVDGSTININNNGVISASNQSYSLPIASANTLGGIKVGTNLSIDSNGVLSASAQTSYTLPTASTTTLGGVKVDGESIVADSNGVISTSTSNNLAYAVADTNGVINLFDTTGYEPGQSGYSGGITYSINDDYSITLTGTATRDVDIEFYTFIPPVNIGNVPYADFNFSRGYPRNNQYVFLCNSNSFDDIEELPCTIRLKSYYPVYDSSTDTTSYDNIYYLRSGYQITYTNTNYYPESRKQHTLTIHIDDDSSLSDLIIYPMIIHQGYSNMNIEYVAPGVLNNKQLTEKINSIHVPASVGTSITDGNNLLVVSSDRSYNVTIDNDVVSRVGSPSLNLVYNNSTGIITVNGSLGAGEEYITKLCHFDGDDDFFKEYLEDKKMILSGMPDLTAYDKYLDIEIYVHLSSDNDDSAKYIGINKENMSALAQFDEMEYYDYEIYIKFANTLSSSGYAIGNTTITFNDFTICPRLSYIQSSMTIGDGLNLKDGVLTSKSGMSKTTLWENEGTTNSSTITLSDSLDNYDFVIFSGYTVWQNYNYPRIVTFPKESWTDTPTPIAIQVEHGSDYIIYYTTDLINLTYQAAGNHGLTLISIIGINF